MTTWMRKISLFALAGGLAFGTAACDDDDGIVIIGSTTTMPAVSTTSTSTTSSTSSSTTSSTSTSSTSMAPTTSSSTTSTSMGGAPACDCLVTWAVTNNETLGSLQYDTDYSAAGGSFEGSGAGVNCTALAGDFTAFNDMDAAQILSAATISTAGFTGPIDVSECIFQTNNAALAPGDFTVTITDQSAPDFSPTNATMAITSVVCTCTGGTSTTTLGPTTTTSTTTSTTVSTSSTTSTTNTTVTTSSTTTTTVVGGSVWDIEFSLDDAVTLGALQYAVDYSAAGGDFVDMADQVNCTSPLSAGGAFVTFNDEDATMTLNFAAVALAGFTGPTVVANCEFQSAAMPVAGNFGINVIDASDPALNPVVPLPGVSVTNVTALP